MGSTSVQVSLKNFIREQRQSTWVTDNAGSRRFWITRRFCVRLANNGGTVRIWRVIDAGRAAESGVLQSSTRFIVVTVGGYRNDGGESYLTYKEISEEEEPYYYDCPLSYLAMTPVDSAAWRQHVISRAEAKRPGSWLRAQQQAQRNAAKQLHELCRWEVSDALG